jgi:hypothetical protein
MTIPRLNVLKNARMPLLLAIAVLAGCSREPENAADTVYSGGDILTMAGEQPAYVEALAVKDGKISFAGSKAEADKLIGKATLEVNLQGATVIPAIASSGMPAAMATETMPSAPNCWRDAPPATSKELIEALTVALKNRKASDVDGLYCTGFDPGAFGSSPALTETDLDEAFPDNPVILVHAGGNVILSNSSAKKRFPMDTYMVLKGAMQPGFIGLQAGQSADFMVLDKNPLKATAEPLSAIQITQAFVAGKSVPDAPKDLSMLVTLDLNAAAAQEKSTLAKIEAQRAAEAADKAAEASAAAAKKADVAAKKANTEAKPKPAAAPTPAKQQAKRSNEKKPLAPKPAVVETPAVAEAPQPKEVRFNMTQDGKKMTPEDFDAWMKAQGIRIVPAKPVEAPPADAKKDGG